MSGSPAENAWTIAISARVSAMSALPSKNVNFSAATISCDIIHLSSFLISAMLYSL